jgi:hypothetical protein
MLPYYRACAVADTTTPHGRLILPSRVRRAVGLTGCHLLDGTARDHHVARRCCGRLALVECRGRQLPIFRYGLCRCGPRTGESTMSRKYILPVCMLMLLSTRAFSAAFDCYFYPGGPRPQCKLDTAAPDKSECEYQFPTPQLPMLVYCYAEVRPPGGPDPENLNVGCALFELGAKERAKALVRQGPRVPTDSEPISPSSAGSDIYATGGASGRPTSFDTHFFAGRLSSGDPHYWATCIRR